MGYLTFNPDYKSANRHEYELRIPNEEIMECFEEKIQKFFKGNQTMQNSTADLVKGLFEGNSEAVETNLNILLKKFVSVRDTATKAPKENYYHGFMNGLLVHGATIIKEHHSNMESVAGYVDIALKSKINDAAAVVEIKQTSDETESKILKAKDAIKQIKDKNYAEIFMTNPDIKNIYIYGICFCQKTCSVVSEKLK